MCELTLANLGSSKDNLEYILIQTIINSVTNFDGTGFFSENEMWKHENAAVLTTDLGQIVKEIFEKESGPIAAHTRKASVLWGKKEIKVEFSHPFLGERFVLAHNGTLDIEDTELDKASFDKLDSAVFHDELEKMAVQNPNDDIQTLLAKTYKKFSGKFAFIIFDKLAKKFYVARGSTASLFAYRCIIKDKIRFVINTEKNDLLAALIMWSNFKQLHGDNSFVFDGKEIHELEKNSIYQVDDEDLIKIGTLEETEKNSFFRGTAGYTNNYRYGTENRGNYTKVTGSKEKTEIEKISEKVANFCESFAISSAYFDEIIFLNLGKHSVELDRDEIIQCETLMEKINSSLVINKKNIVKLWRDLLTIGGFDEWKIHTQLDLPFPYMLCPKKEFEASLEKSEGLVS